MFFRRKPKNRRFERTHILDVKVRSDHRRQTVLRRALLTIGGALALVFGLLLAWTGGEWCLRRFVYANPAFGIHEFQVETDGVISLEQLRNWSGVRLQDNLLALDLARVRRDLELVPAIETVSVERILPHTLRLRVTEREPVAQVSLQDPRELGTNARPSEIYTLDGTGMFMFPIDRAQRNPGTGVTNDHLPVITGLSMRDFRVGRRTDSDQVKAALTLIKAFGTSPMAGLADIRQVDISAPGVLLATTGQNSLITFGVTDLETQLRRWRAVHDHGMKVGRHLAWMDLSVSNNVPARWLEASAVPPPQPKPLKPSPYRKKHV